jgi:hypothetical protein
MAQLCAEPSQSADYRCRGATIDMEPLHVVAIEDPAEPNDLPSAPPGLVRCQECTILIGPGYLETRAFCHPARSGAVCWRCFESLERRAAREDPAAPRGGGREARPWGQR